MSESKPFKARFRSTCWECGFTIEKGVSVVKDGPKLFHKLCAPGRGSWHSLAAREDKRLATFRLPYPTGPEV